MRASNFLLIAIAGIIYTISAPATADNGWQPIKNINEQHIQELGAWAVLEHVRYLNSRIWFNEVLSGKQHGVSAMNYELIIDASDDFGKHGKYKAEVYEQEMTNTRKLLSFGKLN